MVVPSAADGHPMDAVAPGASYLYAFNANPRASLNWYHPHPHMLTGRQVALGLAGAFIIRDSVESGLGLPAGRPYEVPLVVRDASFDSAGNLTYTAKLSGFTRREPLVNGTRQPALAVDRAIYRFRILAASNARVWRFALDNRIDFRVPLGAVERWRFTTGGNAPHPVHVHGAYFQVQSRSGGRGALQPWEQGWKDTVLLEDGETVDVLVRFDRFRGVYLLHCHKLEHEDMGMMANFEVT